MASTYTHVQVSPITAPEAPVTHQIHTDIADHVMQICYYATRACRLMKILWQCTVTVDTPTIEAQISLAHGDVAGALVAHIDDSVVTIPDNLVAADTIYELEIPGGHDVAAGTSVIGILHRAGTGGGPGGSVKIWAVVQPSGA